MTITAQQPRTRLEQLLHLREQVDNAIDAERGTNARRRRTAERIGIPLSERPLLIVAAACDAYQVTAGDIARRSRRTDIADARATIAWLCRQVGVSVPEVCNLLGCYEAAVHAKVARVRGNQQLLERARDLLTYLLHTAEEMVS